MRLLASQICSLSTTFAKEVLRLMTDLMLVYASILTLSKLFWLHRVNYNGDKKEIA